MGNKIPIKELDKIIDKARKESRQEFFDEIKQIIQESDGMSQGEFYSESIPKMAGMAYVKSGHLAETIISDVLNYLDLIDHNDD